jgi:hypothetical protein
MRGTSAKPACPAAACAAALADPGEPGKTPLCEKSLLTHW